VKKLVRGLIGATLLYAVTPLRLYAQSLSDTTRRAVDSVFKQYDKTDSPGCSLGIYRDGRIIYARGYGMANLELGIANSPKTVFDIGSTSKQFSAFAIGLLAKDGKLSLEDPIRKHIPELGPYADVIKLGDLVHHTSGLRDYLTLMYLAGFRFDDVTDDQDALNLIVKQKAANFPPNSEWLYSNTGYFLLSQVVKRVSGQSLREFATARMFGPLNMTETHFHDDHTMIVPNRATGYSPGDKGGYTIEMSGFEQTGDGAVQTTVEDMLKWDQNWYDGTVGGKDLLEIQQRTGKLTNDEDHHYAAGLFISTYRGLKTVRHGGAWAGYRAELLRFPDQHTSIACLCNRGDADPSSFAEQVADVILSSSLQPKAAAVAPNGNSTAATVSLPPEVLATRAGVWRSPRTNDIYVLELKENRLQLSLGARSIPLTPLAINKFLLGPYTLVFEDAPKPVLKVERDGRVDDSYERLPATTPDPAGLSVYAGKWFSDELSTTWDLVPDGNGLRVEVRSRPLFTARAVSKDLFSGGQAHLAFTRDSNGTISGFTVNAGRVRGIGFTRVAR
jgi:CubicO group peptidase (beta-lactamase class C family)